MFTTAHVNKRQKTSHVGDPFLQMNLIPTTPPTTPPTETVCSLRLQIAIEIQKQKTLELQLQLLAQLESQQNTTPLQTTAPQNVVAPKNKPSPSPAKKTKAIKLKPPKPEQLYAAIKCKDADLQYSLFKGNRNAKRGCFFQVECANKNCCHKFKENTFEACFVKDKRDCRMQCPECDTKFAVKMLVKFEGEKVVKGKRKAFVDEVKFMSKSQTRHYFQTKYADKLYNVSARRTITGKEDVARAFKEDRRLCYNACYWFGTESQKRLSE